MKGPLKYFILGFLCYGNCYADNSILQFVIGNEVWQPGEQYKSSSNWLALVCQKSNCEFVKAQLKTKPENWQGHYDEEPTAGQKLTFTSEKPSQKVLAWFNKDQVEKYSWLKLGPIKTYASSESDLPIPAGSKGTEEVEIVTEENEAFRLIPLYKTENLNFILQLRSKKVYQTFSDILGNCGYSTSKKIFFVWSGDLDLDGKPDFLINFIADEGPVKLYLSSKADKDEIVGEAGTYWAPPSGGECD